MHAEGWAGHGKGGPVGGWRTSAFTPPSQGAKMASAPSVQLNGGHRRAWSFAASLMRSAVFGEHLGGRGTPHCHCSLPS